MYDDKSVLEQMHYALILQIMRHNSLGFVLDRPASGASFRKLLLGTVLATDMGVHFEFMAEFDRFLRGEEFPEFKKRVLVCQALIKCADISNPVRARRSDRPRILLTLSLFFFFCLRADRTLCLNIGHRRWRRSGAASCFLRGTCSCRRL